MNVHSWETCPSWNRPSHFIRGYGLQVWSFSQDIEQVRSCYPTGHSTLVNKPAVLQTFGISNSQMARQLAEIIDISQSELLNMKTDHLAVFAKEQGTQKLRLPDYLKTLRFVGFGTVIPSLLDFRNLSARLMLVFSSGT